MGKQVIDAPRKQAFMLDPRSVVVIGVDTDHTARTGDHGHIHWDPRVLAPVDTALAANIRTYGVLKPVLVEKDGDQVIVIDGRRRTLACRAAWDAATAAGEEVPYLPVFFTRGTEAHQFGVSRAANQFARPETVLEKAEAAQRMLDLNPNVERVAVTFGVQPRTIRDWISLLALAEPVRQAVAAEEISPAAAAALTELSKTDQVKKLAELRATGGKLTRARVKARVRQTQDKPVSKPPKARIEDALARLTAIAVQHDSDAVYEALSSVCEALCGKTLAALLKAKS